MVLDSVNPHPFSIPAMREENGGQMKDNKGHSDIHNALGQFPQKYIISFLFDFSQSLAEHLARIELVYPQLALCNSAGKSTLSDKLVQRIGQLNAKWHICAREEKYN
jgi:hypothetical protein